MKRMSAIVLALGLLAVLLIPAAKAEAIPAFARKHKLACNACHTIFPQLTRFGRDFRDNGFRMPDEVQTLLRSKKVPAAPEKGELTLVASHAVPTAGHQGETSTTQDFWSFIPEEIPFSIQAKLHLLIDPKGEVKTDAQLEELQLQTGGILTPRVSYYLHHHLAEEGEPGDLYTGWVRFNTLAGSQWLTVGAGQFELPLSFSPEIERLSSFEYLVFGRELGVNPFNLNTPQVGIHYFGQSAKGTKIWAGVVNGSGLTVNEETETFDSNSFKDVFARVTQEIGEHYIGGFIYAGQAHGSSTSAGAFSDDFVRAGGDAFVNLNTFILLGSVLYGRDADPLGLGESRSFVGGFIQGQVHVSDRTVVLARFDAVRQPRPAEIGEGGEEETEEAPAFRVNTLAFTPGIQYLVLPNVKLGVEYQIRQTRREDRGILQLHVSF